MPSTSDGSRSDADTILELDDLNDTNYIDDNLSSDSGTITSLEEIESDEVKACELFNTHNGTYDSPENIFTPTEIDEMKKRESIVIKRNSKG